MTIWEAFWDNNWRGGYKRILNAKGYSATAILDIMHRFKNYLDRINDSILGMELRQINDRNAFGAKLDDIFLNKWKNHIQDNYSDMHGHFKAYLAYLDSLQAIHGEYFNEMEKMDLEDPNPQFPITALTIYETEYLVDGKLKTLANPSLLCWTRSTLSSDLSKVKQCPTICQMFYGDLLPNMTPSDYLQLIKSIWSEDKKARGSRKTNVFQIKDSTDGSQVFLGTLEGLQHVISAYGIETVRSKRLQIRGRDLLSRNVLPFQEKEYVQFSDAWYICILGDYKDRMNAINAINMLCGKRFEIKLTMKQPS